MVCTGNGPVTVVLFAGFRDPLTVWRPLQQSLSARARVCAYDRSGEGSSPRTAGPQTFAEMTDALRAALARRGITNRLILVGHSLGGDVAAAYAARFTGVSALVLLDATPPAFPRQAVSLVPPSVRGLTGSIRGDLARVLDWRLNREHLEGRIAFSQLRMVRSLGGVRIRVLAHGDRYLAKFVPKYGSTLESLWQQGQRRWATLARDSRLLVVPGSGHYIYRDRPDVVVSVVDAEIQAT
jgi:pimeloyl-ACP methyl ester carboxylesterase